MQSALETVKTAVTRFLREQRDVKHAYILKVVQTAGEAGKRTWEVEAEVYVPNGTIKALRLPVRRTVLDCRQYLIRLDDDLNIVAYGPKELVLEGEG